MRPKERREIGQNDLFRESNHDPLIQLMGYAAICSPRWLGV
jgi:hypothetical protein